MYIQNNKSQTYYRKTQINKKIIDINSRNRIPFVSSYPYSTVLYSDELTTLDIEFYITDYYQLDYRLDKKYDFDIEINIGQQQTIIKSFKLSTVSGNTTYSTDIHDLPNGDYWFSIQGTNNIGLKSVKIYNEFRITDRINYDSSVYYITDADLEEYNINKNGNYGEYIILSIPEDRIEDAYVYMQEYARDITVPSKSYKCFLSDTDGDGYPNYKSQHIMQYTEGDYTSYIKYADDYDKNIVEQEAINTTIGLRTLINDKISEGFTKIVLPNGYYRTSTQDTIEIIGNHVVIDFNNSTIKSNKLNKPAEIICNIYGDDIHVINATFAGCLLETNYSDFVTEENPKIIDWYELGHSISIAHTSKYSSYENCTVKDVTGYGILNSVPKYVDAPHPLTKWATYSGYTQLSNTDAWVLGELDDSTGEFKACQSSYVYNDFCDISFIGDNQYISINRYLGYQGIAGGSRYFKCYMYDAEKRYLGCEVCMQFRKFWLLSNTKYIKIVALTNIYSYIKSNTVFSLNTLCVVSHTQVVNSEIKHVNIENVRCVGLIPFGKNCTVDDVTIIKTGYAEAHQLVDAEDTWESLQDYTIRNSVIIDGIYHSRLALVSGMNTCIEDSEINLSQYSRAKDTTVRRCMIRGLSIDSSGISQTGYMKVYDNTIDSPLVSTSPYGTTGSQTYNYDIINEKVIINNTNKFIGNNYGTGRNMNVLFKNLTFNMPTDRATTFLSSYDRCTINNLSGRVTNIMATNCIFNNCNVIFENSIYTYEYHIIFYNCTFNNCNIQNKTNLSDDKLFISCNFVDQ